MAEGVKEKEKEMEVTEVKVVDKATTRSSHKTRDPPTSANGRMLTHPNKE